MKAPSKPTEQLWHPSSLFAYNSQDDSDSITSEAKSTGGTTTDLYDRGLTSRRYALAGVACTSIFSIGCIIAGTNIIATRQGVGAIEYQLNSDLTAEMLTLILNLIVTLCTESTGLVHSMSLRSALASESRLRFNTNLRLLTAARGWRNPNGSLLNGVMAVLLTLSYTSASLVILPIGSIDPTMITNGVVTYPACITGSPLLLLGIVMLLQVVIALSGMCAVKILTWSSSPFDVTAALVHHAQLTPVPLRCMCNSMTSDLDVGGGPSRPSEKQPSAWRAHPSIRKVILSLWGLVVACAGWAVLATIISNIFFRQFENSVPWSFFPKPNSQSVFWILEIYFTTGPRSCIVTFVAVALVQGPLTLGLHCSELIVNVMRDERRWRRATGSRGLEMSTNPLKSCFTDPLNLVLLAAKPVLRESFALVSRWCL
jgi:hypothetical protein